ncbi:MAG TPA: MM0924 family protein [Pyrinomonadaceae bacterium]|nr:MM0924 family protein [Pyrinomonadaceae bacterium]
MEDFLSRFIGKKIDVYCGGASSVRGEVLKVETGVLHLRDDDGKSCYVAINKIVVVWEARDDSHKAGFMPPPNNK